MYAYSLLETRMCINTCGIYGTATLNVQWGLCFFQGSAWNATIKDMLNTSYFSNTILDYNQFVGVF